MKIIVPYTHIEPRVKQALKPYKAQYVKMQKDDDYPNLLDKLFKAGDSFINVEHDVAPWRGALEQLWDCPEQWCVFGYSDKDDFSDPGACVYLGCVKFGTEFLQKLKGVWAKMPNRLWSIADCHYTPIARKFYRPHQHFPPVNHIKTLRGSIQ